MLGVCHCTWRNDSMMMTTVTATPKTMMTIPSDVCDNDYKDDSDAGNDDVTRMVMTTTKTTIIMRPWTILKNNIARHIMLGSRNSKTKFSTVLIWGYSYSSRSRLLGHVT